MVNCWFAREEGIAAGAACDEMVKTNGVTQALGVGPRFSSTHLKTPTSQRRKQVHIDDMYFREHAQ